LNPITANIGYSQWRMTVKDHYLETDSTLQHFNTSTLSTDSPTFATSTQPKLSFGRLRQSFSDGARAKTDKYIESPLFITLDVKQY